MQTNQSVILISISEDRIQQLVQQGVAEALSLFKSVGNTQTNLIKDDDQKFTITQLSQYLDKSKVTIHAYKNRGVIPWYQTGRSVYFKKSEIDAALSSNRKGLKHAA